MKILFIGDSITEHGRNPCDPNDLGCGFVSMATSNLLERFPDGDFEFVNRGVGGDTVRDLVRRWERDCIEIKPDLVSLKVGINNVWRRYDYNDPTPDHIFAREYESLLIQAKEQLQAELIICQPFLTPINEEQEDWFEDLDPKIEIIEQLAIKYNAKLVPLHEIFFQAMKEKPATYWSEDGVHPTAAGHKLIADSWLELFLS